MKGGTVSGAAFFCIGDRIGMDGVRVGRIPTNLEPQTIENHRSISLPHHLLNLRGVPEDELQEIRDLLNGHDIDFYETPAGNWGISSPGLWLRGEQRAAEARALLDDYQRQRSLRVRAEYQELQQQGRAERLIDRLWFDPLRFLFYVAVIVLVLYVSIGPFVSL